MQRPLHMESDLPHYISIFGCKLCALVFSLFRPTGKESFHFVSKQLTAK